LIDEALRVRAEAERSRVLSLALRVEVRRQAQERAARRARALQSCRRAERLRRRRCPTAWSSLLWSPPSDDLDRILEGV